MIKETLDSLVKKATETRILVMREDYQREKIQDSEGYQDLVIQADAIRVKQEDMLYVVPDSKEHLEDLKLLITAKMQDEGRSVYENIEMKFRKKREVNTRQVMQVLEGDMDNFFLLAQISQKNLKEFGDDNPEYKKGFKDCVSIVSEECTGIVIHLPD